MYNALYECCGGGLNARSIATVWTAIIDRTANEELDGKLVVDGGRNWIMFNDSFWKIRLRMSRPTIKVALDWLEAAKVIDIKKQKKGQQSYPTRYVALVPGTLETIIDNIKGKGGSVEDLEFPLLTPEGTLLPPQEAAPVRESLKKDKAPKNGLDVRGEDRGRRHKKATVRPLTEGEDTNHVKDLIKGVQGSYKRCEKEQRGNCKTFDDQMKEDVQPFVRGLTTKSSLEEITEDIEKGTREDFSANPGSQQQPEEALATHAASGVDLLRKVQDISLVSGNEQQQPKPSETKETQKPPVPNLPEEEKRPPSVRAAAIAFPKTSQFLETIKGRMVPLSSSLGEPWGVLGFDDRGSIAAACSLDWKYAVRRNDLKDLVLAFPGCPIEYWDIWESETDDEGKPIPAKDRTTDHGACIAAVQAWLEYAETKGLPDPWQDIAGKDRETEWPKHGAKIAKDAPSWEDRGFREYFKSAYQELRRTK